MKNTIGRVLGIISSILAILLSLLYSIFLIGDNIISLLNIVVILILIILSILISLPACKVNKMLPIMIYSILTIVVIFSIVCVFHFNDGNSITECLMYSSSLIISLAIMILLLSNKMNNKLSIIIYGVLIICTILIPQSIMYLIVPPTNSFLYSYTLNASYFKVIAYAFTYDKYFYMPPFILMIISILILIYCFLKHNKTTD